MTVENQCRIYQAAEVAVGTAAAAGLGVCCARVCSIIADPARVAMFSAASYLTHLTILPLFEKTFGNLFASDATKAIGTLFSMGTAIAIASGASTLIGMPVSLHLGLAIACSMVAVETLAALARQMTATTVVS